MMNKRLFSSAVLILAVTVFNSVRCQISKPTSRTECILKEFETVVHHIGCEPSTLKEKACVAKECLSSSNLHWIDSVCEPINKWTAKPQWIKLNCNGKEKRLRVLTPEPMECGKQE